MDQSRQYTLIVGPFVDVEDEQTCAACGTVFVSGEIVTTLVDGDWDETTTGADVRLLHGRCAGPLVAQLAQEHEGWEGRMT